MGHASLFSSSLIVSLAVVASGTTGCQERVARAEAKAEPVDAPPAAALTVEATAPLPPVPPAAIERLEVQGDSVASVVRPLRGGAPRLVFLGGVCSNAYAYLSTFPEAARAYGGAVAIEGDQPCGNLKDFHTYSWDAARQNTRIEAALGAAGADLATATVTVVGYSQGASIAEQLATRWPRRYVRVVLIGAPTDPAPKSFANTTALVTMSCARDVPARMRQAAVRTQAAGTPATYFEMPGCTHGNVADAEVVFGTAFEWLDVHAHVRAPGEGPID